jgi:hypothetical protein
MFNRNLRDTDGGGGGAANNNNATENTLTRQFPSSASLSSSNTLASMANVSGVSAVGQINHTLCFHLAQSINAQTGVLLLLLFVVSFSIFTDCYLVPSIDTVTSTSTPMHTHHDDTSDTCTHDKTQDVQHMTMAVHWLNNKELMFSLGAEKLLSKVRVCVRVCVCYYYYCRRYNHRHIIRIHVWHLDNNKVRNKQKVIVLMRMMLIVYWV